MKFFFFLNFFGVVVDDKYVYWNEYLFFGWVFWINKNDISDVDDFFYGLYDFRGFVVKKGNYIWKSEYIFKKCYFFFRM